MGALGSSTGFFTYEGTWDVAFPSMRESPDLALPDLLASMEPGARRPPGRQESAHRPIEVSPCRPGRSCAFGGTRTLSLLIRRLFHAHPLPAYSIADLLKRCSLMRTDQRR